jgi:hypothetical protein
MSSGQKPIKRDFPKTASRLHSPVYIHASIPSLTQIERLMSDAFFPPSPLYLILHSLPVSPFFLKAEQSSVTAYIAFLIPRQSI